MILILRKRLTILEGRIGKAELQNCLISLMSKMGVLKNGIREKDRVAEKN